MKRFNIFIKSKKINWTANKIAFLIFVILFIVYQINKKIEDPVHDSIDKYMAIVGVVLFIAGTLYKFSKISKPEKLNGKLTGFLEFKLDSIIIGQEEYKLDEIAQIRINNNDYYLKANGSSRGFDSNLSNGVDNYLTLTLKDKKSVSCMFEIYYEHDIRKLDEILINYYSKGKLDFSHLTKILKLKDSEVKNFKRIYDI